MTIEDIKSVVATFCDTLTVGSVIGYIMEWFTIPNLVGFFTLVWAIARAFQAVTGKSIYEFYKKEK
jgi:hypothetical protein